MPGGEGSPSQEGGPSQEELTGAQNQYDGEEQEEECENEQMAESAQNAIPQPLPQLSNPKRLTKEELAYGCTFFSNVHGYANPLNVVTAKAMQTRLQPISQISLHNAIALLRPPFSEKAGRNFSDTKEMRDLELHALAPCEIGDIMNYRVSGCDDIDFALESFKMLGARSEDDTVPISRLSGLLIDCYQQLDYQMECIDDYKLHCKAVEVQLEAEAKKNTDYRPNTQQKKKQEEKFILAPEEDILQVITMVNGGKDVITLDDWKALFFNISQLEFVDYKKQIQAQRFM